MKSHLEMIYLVYLFKTKSVKNESIFSFIPWTVQSIKIYYICQVV